MARPFEAAPCAARPARGAARPAVLAATLAATALSLGACGHNPYAMQASFSDRECLARAMYFESNRSSEDGMLAVGTVVMNRLQSGRYPKTICGVVGQPNQFADGVLSKPAGGRSMDKALQVADAVIAGERHDKVGGAMFFHTAGYTFPYRNMAYLVAAGGNVFYEKRTPGTFTPIHPATLVAQAEPVRVRRAAPARVQLAAADEDDLPLAATGRVREERQPRREERSVRETRGLDLVRPRVERSGHRERPIVVAALRSAPSVREKGPPTIAELIDLDLPPRARAPLAINRDGGRR